MADAAVLSSQNKNVGFTILVKMEIFPSFSKTSSKTVTISSNYYLILNTRLLSDHKQYLYQNILVTVLNYVF